MSAGNTTADAGGARAALDCLDVAVIGLGAAGLYCLHRLSHARDDLSIAGFEMEDEPGGRLHSLVADEGQAPLECGAAFVSSAHFNLLGLALTLGCELAEVGFKQAGAYLRGRWSRAGEGLFALSPDEVGKSAAELVTGALARTAPELEHVLRQRPSPALAAGLRAVEVDGCALWQWPAGALLERAMSHEAVALARATHGSTAMYGPVNAHDMLSTHVWESAPGQRFYRLRHGFHNFARALAAARGAASIHLRHRLLSIDHDGTRFKLAMMTPAGVRLIEAGAVILALPQQALVGLNLSADMTGQTFAADLAAVAPIAAFKLFLAFERDWWSAAHRCGAGEICAVFTDLALQQCYFETFAAAPHWVLAAFADAGAAAYWRALKEPGEPERAIGRAPPGMIAAAMRQLQCMYGALPAPLSGVYADWTGAWHAWRPHARSWEARARLRQPNPDLPLFICGEAMAERQGWTEGAFNNAEAMLERAFGLDRPAWVGRDVPFEN